ncbi:MAG: hypothetical protein IT372_08620 [Polyangiaceae bacterium]|nr:hypothetical protein [Polyangiaceae bacterium]
MSAPRAPIRVEGRRLRAVRLSPAAAAIALALLVASLVGWIASLLTAIAPLGALSGLCGAAAFVIAARHTWRRLTRPGRVLFGLPAALFLLSFSLAAFELPGASAAGMAGGVALIVAIALGVVGQPALSVSHGLARARVDPSFLRSEEPAEPLPVVLDERGLHFGADGADSSELWRGEEIATAELGEDGDRLVLRITDRVGDEIAVELAPGSRAAAEEIVERLGVRRR